MAKTANIQNVLDSFLQRIGDQVARGVRTGIESSGLLKELKNPRGNAPSSKPGRKKGAAKNCSINGCGKPARARGLCVGHYQKARYAEKTAKPGKPIKKTAKVAKRDRPKKA